MCALLVTAANCQKIGGTLLCITILWGACLVTTSAANGQELCEVSPSESLARIIPNGHEVEGTGVILTADGYIITARHVIEGYLDIFVKFEGKDELTRATVVAADEYLDVAILKAEIERDHRPNPALVKIGQDAGLTNLSKLCVGGYGINKVTDPETGFTRTTVDPLTFNNMTVKNHLYGYTFIEGQIKSGFSGGGAFVEDRLYGINLERGRFGSRILPFRKVHRFLQRSGFGVDDDGNVVFVLDLESLAQQVKNNRGNIRKILTDVRWDAKVEDGKVILFFEKILPKQSVTGFFSGKAYPKFTQDTLEVALPNDVPPPWFPVNGDVSQGWIEIEDVDDELQGTVLRYEEDHDVSLPMDDIFRLEIIGTVTIISTREKLDPIQVIIPWNYQVQ